MLSIKDGYDGIDKDGMKMKWRWNEWGREGELEKTKKNIIEHRIYKIE